MSTVKKRSPILNVLIHAVLIFLAAFQLFPLVVLFINTLRTDVEIKHMPIGLPEHASFLNYAETWVKGSYAVAFRNSIFIGACVIGCE